MHLQYLLPIVALSTLAFAVWFFRRALPAYQRMRVYAERVAQCGHLEPLTDAGLARRDRLTHFFFWLHVGSMKVIGKEKLQNLPTKAYLVTPNHGNMNDVVVLPELMRGHREYYMGTRDLMTCLGGLGAQLIGPMGMIATDLTKGKGSNARLMAVKLLSQNEPLVMFPEGYSYCDGSMGEFKHGAVRIAREAAEILGHDTYIVPVHLRYGRYPGKWIMKLDIQLQYLMCILLSPLYRRGVTIVIGDPIPSSSISSDVEQETLKLQRVICALDLSGKATAELPEVLVRVKAKKAAEAKLAQ